MFTILKYELQYLRFNMLPTLLPVAAMAALLIFGSENIINGTSYILSLAIFGQLLGARGKEKRSFREIVYPASRKLLARTRSLFIYLPVITIYLTGLIAHLLVSGVGGEWRDSIYELTMMHGLIIMIGHLYYFFSDSFSLFRSSNGKLVFNIIAVSLCLLLMILLSHSVEASFSNSYSSGISSLIFIWIAGVVLSKISTYTFNYRESLID